jgi:hypothetical protein
LFNAVQAFSANGKPTLYPIVTQIIALSTALTAALNTSPSSSIGSLPSNCMLNSLHNHKEEK